MSDLKRLLKTTDRYVAILQSNGIFTLKDLFNYFPRTHEDRQSIDETFQESQWTSSKQKQQVRVYVTEKKITSLRMGKKIYEVRFHDQQGVEGKATYRWSPYIFQSIQTHQWYVVVWKPKIIKGKAVFNHPEFILSSWPADDTDGNDVHTSSLDDFLTNNFASSAHQSTESSYNIGRLYPVYPEMLGIKSWWFAKKIREVLPHIESAYSEYLPDDFRREFDLADVATSIRSLHYPRDPQDLVRAKSRVYFDRLLKIQLQSLIHKQTYEANNHHTSGSHLPDRSLVTQIVDMLPFSLTSAQKKVTRSIIEDLCREKPMMRLLQWDVGSGKTIVAAIAAYYIIRKQRWQVAFLVPIELLAQQHYANLVRLFHPLGIQVRLLTGSVSASQKQRIKQELKAWMVELVVGTHALIQDTLWFRNLQLVIIDEQHKFWVKQRSFFQSLWAPHLLQMTATPIPRTLAMAYFAEFEVSVIDEMPAGRKPIITKVVTHKQRPQLKWWILDRIAKGQSVFVVVPLVYESEYLEWVHHALWVYEQYIQEFMDSVWSESIALIHGKLPSKEKESIMQKFKQGSVKILISTTVIEVWVDIPQATIMIIKNAERFWLSQLHQLRGRVGRSDLQSYCFLETKNISGNERLRAMEDHTDGFKLAEIDMKLRGTGEIMGVRQSWESDIPLEILTDPTMIEKVQGAAQRLFDHYPHLEWLSLLESELDYIPWVGV